MANIGYRTFTGSDTIGVTHGSLASQAAVTLTIAVMFKLNTFSADAELFNGPGFNQDLFLVNSINEASYYDGAGDDNGNGPHVAVADGWAIMVMAKDGTNPVGWSMYDFDLDNWVHDASGNTLASSVAFAASGTINIGGPPTFLGDLAAVAVWAGTKLDETERETLSIDLAAWEDLAPSELWRMDESTPGDAVIGTSTQVSISGTSVTAEGSPLAEGAFGGGGGGGGGPVAYWGILGA